MLFLCINEPLKNRIEKFFDHLSRIKFDFFRQKRPNSYMLEYVENKTLFSQDQKSIICPSD